MHCKKDNISTNRSQSSSSESVLRPGDENLTVVGLSQTKTGSLFNNWGESIANYCSRQVLKISRQMMILTLIQKNCHVPVINFLFYYRILALKYLPMPLLKA
jgi:hypothetical protein